jgi:hypothetical protein
MDIHIIYSTCVKAIWGMNYASSLQFHLLQSALASVASLASEWSKLESSKLLYALTVNNTKSSVFWDIRRVVRWKSADVASFFRVEE